jgi:lysophospholipase L1-like esterase
MKKRVFLFLLVILALLEVLLRLLNSFYPLFRPQVLQDTFENHWLEGYNWKNGLTRLYVYKPKPGATTYGHPFNINSYGFRGRDFKDRAAEGLGTFRIMVLGDSITMGQGVAEEDRYTDVLEGKLRAKYLAVKFEIINLGVQGYETIQEEKTLIRMWPIVEPDLTIVGFCWNDTNITYEHDQPHRLSIEGRKRGLLEHFLTFQIIDRIIYDPVYRAITHEPSAVEEIIASYRPESRDWKVFEQSVKNIAEFVRAKTGNPPFVIELSNLSRFLGQAKTAGEWKRDGYYLLVRAAFEKAGFIWVDLEDTFSYKVISRFEAHPNEETHAQFAEALFSEIVKRGLVTTWRETH